MVRLRRKLGPWAILSSVVFSWTLILSPAVVLASTVRIPVGTIVTAGVNDAIDPSSVSPGQMVTLSVITPVLIDGVKVIEAGAPVTAEVVVSQTKGAVGKPAKVGIALRNVAAVDGTLVPLSGQRQVEGENKQGTSLVVTILCCVLGLLMKGGEASIPAGAQIQGTTMAESSVSVP